MSRVINKDIEQVAIDLLKHHPRNANHGDIEAIKTSLAVNGWYGSVVVNTGTKHILAGNHRVMAAKALGWETVPVQWVDVTPEEELRILVVDNRTTRIGQDDTTKITDILAELANTPIGLEGTGYGAADLDALIDELAGMTEPAELLTDPDEVPEDVETRCKAGDLWILGRHRLLCGDSTKADDVARLMDGKKANMVFTDPPYNIGFSGSMSNTTVKGKLVKHKGANTKHEDIANDFMSPDDFSLFMNKVLLNIKQNVTGAWYISFGSQTLEQLLVPLRENQMDWKSIIVWMKNQATLSGKDYKSRYEPIVYGRFNDDFYAQRYEQEDIWQYQRTLSNDLHPTMKPIPLISYAVQNSSKQNDIVLDLFLGSGSTIISCEQEQRVCYGLELNTHYCDVIIQRWENATGQKAVLSEG
jgi:DNA modification methylase